MSEQIEERGQAPQMIVTQVRRLPAGTDPLPAPAPDSILAIIAQAARDPQVDVAKMEALLKMKREVDQDAAKIAFAGAMRDAQSEIKAVVRDAENEHTRSKYARLESIDEKIRPIYTKHGFSLSFNAPRSDKDGVTVTCDALHIGGYSKPYELTGGLDVAGSQGKSNKTPIQGLGSSVSYLRRYLTLMIFNVPLKGEDNDGNSTNPLNDEQFRNVRCMADECAMDGEELGKFLKYMRVPKIEEIRRCDYDRAMEALRGKLRQKQGGAK